MNIRIAKGDGGREKIIASDSKGRVLGNGYISPFLSSDLYDKQRY